MAGEFVTHAPLYRIERFQGDNGRPSPEMLAYYQKRNNRERAMRHSTLEWSAHSEKSRLRVFEAVSGLSGDALIVGPGVGMDISLDAIVRQFNSVTLVDIDEKGVRETIEELEPVLQSKVTLVVDDLTGAAGETYRKLTDA